jgi:hypothetical protein
MSITEKTALKFLEELQVANERLDRITNALEGVFSALLGNDELGLDGILPVLQRMERKQNIRVLSKNINPEKFYDDWNNLKLGEKNMSEIEVWVSWVQDGEVHFWSSNIGHLNQSPSLTKEQEEKTDG